MAHDAEMSPARVRGLRLRRLPRLRARTIRSPIGAVEKNSDALGAALDGHDRVEIRGPDCDLRLSIRGRTFISSCGTHNMPDGEIFTGPVETSVEGWARFAFPVIYKGREVDGVELTFREGRVVEAKAAKNEGYLNQMLDTTGARYLGEFGIGTNAIRQLTRNILLDEKIGGTIHLALGAGYPDTGSHNRRSTGT